MEWARIEVAAAEGREYTLPALRHDFSGSVISLARQEWPDLSGYTDPEIVMRLHKRHHAGIVLRTGSAARLGELIESYTERFLREFNAVIAAPDKPTS